ncbi:unnamed protein product [Protopolystoma xenopodis]|uniref:Uncharacterized protein n=1 Tax=Protopolystoma xenopodis TaxID=117903 RepID=A0A3S5BC03_9PLAT|nr:unnamed protein product [Protopolystoma xenopodis]
MELYIKPDGGPLVCPQAFPVCLHARQCRLNSLCAGSTECARLGLEWHRGADGDDDDAGAGTNERGDEIAGEFG